MRIHYIFLFLLLSNCGQVKPKFLPSDLDPTGSEIKLSASVRKQRLQLIANSLKTNGITQPILIAGIASAETSLAHCYSEATYHCQGPQSSDCGGPVLAGSGDGACSLKQGGLGMFQFDSGTHQQTLNTYGNGILTVAGNTAAVIPFFVNKLTSTNSAMRGIVASIGMSHIKSRADFIAWVNTIEVGGGTRYELWLKMVACLYNGACPGIVSASLQSQRIEAYRSHTSLLRGEMPAGSSDTVSIAPIEDTPTVSDTEWDDFARQFKLIPPEKLKCSNLYITNLSGDSTVRIRQAPSTNSPVVTNLSDGTDIVIEGAIAGNEQTRVTDSDLADAGLKGSGGIPGVETIWLKLKSPVSGWVSKLYANCR